MHTPVHISRERSGGKQEKCGGFERNETTESTSTSLQRIYPAECYGRPPFPGMVSYPTRDGVGVRMVGCLLGCVCCWIVGEKTTEADEQDDRDEDKRGGGGAEQGFNNDMSSAGPTTSTLRWVYNIFDYLGGEKRNATPMVMPGRAVIDLT